MADIYYEIYIESLEHLRDIHGKVKSMEKING